MRNMQMCLYVKFCGIIFLLNVFKSRTTIKLKENQQKNQQVKVM